VHLHLGRVLSASGMPSVLYLNASALQGAERAFVPSFSPLLFLPGCLCSQVTFLLLATPLFSLAIFVVFLVHCSALFSWFCFAPWSFCWFFLLPQGHCLVSGSLSCLLLSPNLHKANAESRISALMHIYIHIECLSFFPCFAPTSPNPFRIR
jgi:hypothetical protein